MPPELARRGILGINRRNFDFVQCWNPRSAYREVDDKVRTKRLAEDADVPVPATLGVVSAPHELRRLGALLDGRDAFVVKPARGAQGNGILVVRERCEGGWRRADGSVVTLEDVRFRLSEILSGLFSLGGQPDHALVEECLNVHPALDRLCRGGVPDLRVILHRGVPAMAMLRLPTAAADGRANLHQGAVGVGVSLVSGRTVRAALGRRRVSEHPDTGAGLIDLAVPEVDEALARAVRLGMASRLGYLGVDLVIDEERGPLVLELNARPGLSIQAANGRGLLPALHAIERRVAPDDGPARRLALARQIARELEA